MPTLSIKNVPESVLAKLRERAVQRHRSLQGELLALLLAVVEPASSSHSAASLDALPLARRSGSRRIEEIADEHRSLRKKPVSKGPLAVDLIRAERDAR